jgi:hypothetical protein
MSAYHAHPFGRITPSSATPALAALINAVPFSTSNTNQPWILEHLVL